MKKVILKDDNGNELNTVEGFERLKKGESIGIEFNLSPKTKEIPNDLLKEKWRELKDRFKQRGYLVDSFQMPQILGLVLIPEDFDAALKELFYIGSFDKEEYGKITYPDSKSSAFIKDIGLGEKYLLFICEGRYDFNKDLEHELTHIFENFLNLKSGELVN